MIPNVRFEDIPSYKNDRGEWCLSIDPGARLVVPPGPTFLAAYPAWRPPRSRSRNG